MRASTLIAPREWVVEDVPVPMAAPGEVLVEVHRVGVCGTDVELYTGEMAYVQDGLATYPMRLGHEWAGIVVATGAEVDSPWVGRRVTGDTMLGDQTCERCKRGRQHLCDRRQELGVRGGRPGALAEFLAVPVHALHELPASVDCTAGALVEPGGNALRAAQASQAGPGHRVLVLGPGTIGLLVGLFARSAGAEVHVLGLPGNYLDFAGTQGFAGVWTEESLPAAGFDAVVEASGAAHLPSRAVELVEPGGRVVFIGLAGERSLVDTRRLALNDVTAVGVLSASPALADTIDAYALGAVDARGLVCATVGLEEVGHVLAGHRPLDAGPGPKVHVDPRR
jgi:threonine dehydrogenase-like Zn-dependent dehydrogenase